MRAPVLNTDGVLEDVTGTVNYGARLLDAVTAARAAARSPHLDADAFKRFPSHRALTCAVFLEETPSAPTGRKSTMAVRAEHPTRMPEWGVFYVRTDRLFLGIRFPVDVWIR